MIIYGIHACEVVIQKSLKKIKRVYVLETKQRPPSWLTQIPHSMVHMMDSKEFNQILPKGSVHQGIAIEIGDFEYSDITELKTGPVDCVVAMLDGVTDPHNLGAIIRSAAAFGIYGVILLDKTACHISGTVAKVASGGLEYIKIIRVKNLAQAIEKLKTYGFWIIALSEGGTQTIRDVGISGKICVLLGDEGQGIRRNQLEKSDFIVRLPTVKYFPTLNVSTAASVTFYETLRQREF
ncbi:MAG: 23S rRNA (guanosine(2251)-2'-O)-methyltransferase RlmB [Holosporales bacterium]|jgi:23S rRNA (guanosine2251-2'-O)-methyltransferase|nr:23S rRNA (guanosine(2251)-2'-O)-methyltransferase RlmB [Holosporales bacterium]